MRCRGEQPGVGWVILALLAPCAFAATLTVTVSSADSAQFLQQARVELSPTGRETMTDKLGVAVLSEVAPGDYTVWFAPYVQWSYVGRSLGNIAASPPLQSHRLERRMVNAGFSLRLPRHLEFFLDMANLFDEPQRPTHFVSGDRMSTYYNRQNPLDRLPPTSATPRAPDFVLVSRRRGATP